MGMTKKSYKAFLFSLVVLAGVGALLCALFLFHGSASAPTPQSTTKQSTMAKPKDSFNKQRFSLEDPTSQWVVVNKIRPLNPSAYSPSDLVEPNVPQRVPGNESMRLRTETAKAVESMFAAAKADQTPLMLSSGFRSYSFQTGLYNGYVTKSGQAAADTYSARPGYSEHQTGLAFDVEPLDQQCDVDECFADLPAGKWVAAHAHEYGFIVRYPANKTAVTGYKYEPWHLRYVGKELAAEMKAKNITTLEEFFGLPAAPDYR